MRVLEVENKMTFVKTNLTFLRELLFLQDKSWIVI
jgi:hypothetical protein